MEVKLIRETTEKEFENRLNALLAEDWHIESFVIVSDPDSFAYVALLSRFW